MDIANKSRKYDVIIAGAGPAGCACALSLQNSGLRVALFDKQTFPRDKVCGDAIPGRSIRTLGEINPLYAEAFRQFPEKYLTRSTSLYYKGKILERTWVREAYTCARIHFDFFLFSLVEACKSVDVYPATAVNKVSIQGDEVHIQAGKTGEVYTAKAIVGADGAHSVVAKQLTAQTLNRKHHVASVRAYYKNVSLTNTDRTEIFFDRTFFPGYLWIFPLPGNLTNVGFGMLSAEIARRKINLKESFYAFIQNTPALKERFRQAEPVGELQGFGLPIGSHRPGLSGERFLLAGDAGSLIDPASGDGIGNAMLSGRLAARQLLKSFQKNDFSTRFLQQYDQALYKTIGPELRTSTLLLRTGSRFPFLLDMAFLAGKKEGSLNRL